MKRLDSIVRAAHTRFAKGCPTAPGGEAVDWLNPLDELIAKEEGALADAEKDVLGLAADGDCIPEALRALIREAVFDEFRQFQDGFLEWLFAAGPHPLEVMRRLFAYTKMHRASLLLNMGFRQIGPLLDETHAAAAHRCKVLFGDVPAGWKKPGEAVERMREAQLGNGNRRNGKRQKAKGTKKKDL